MERVASDTEHIFTQKFFSMLDGAINAVDNVPARLLLIFYLLPIYLWARCKNTSALSQLFIFVGHYSFMPNI